MSRVWVYDLNKTKKYREAVRKAKKAGRKAPARWQVTWYDYGRKVKSEVASTKVQAEDRRTQIERTLQEGIYTDPAAARVQFAEMADKWLDTRYDLHPSSWWKYRGLLDNHVLPRWGGLPLFKLLRADDDIEVWVATLIKPGTAGGSGLGPSQARHAYRVLAMVLEWCVPHRIPRNPARGVTVPILPEYEHVYLTYEQVEALAEASGELRTTYHQPTACAHINRVFILVLAYTGIRWSEAAALRVRRIDLTHRRIRIASTFYELNGALHEGLPKNGKPRSVPIPEFLCPDLEALMADHDKDNLVFRTRRGLPLRANNWRNREFTPAITAAGLDLPGFTPHGLRHTAASLAIASGADIKVIQTMLGHKTASMTLDIYGHLFPDRLDEIATALHRNRQRALQNVA
jgi:integrase